MSKYKSINPATDEVLGIFEETTSSEIETALAHSHEAYQGWKSTSVSKRAQILHFAAEIYRERRDDLSRLIGSEMGKPFGEGLFEVDLVANIFDYYATNGPVFMSDEEIVVSDGNTALIRKAPIGSILGIMPWNFPYYQVARFAVPNIMLGNTVMLKHAPSCPQAALAIQSIFADAGLPDYIYQNIFATDDQVADIIADSRNQGVSITGSERAGSSVAQIAGCNLKKCVLELGGSDPFIVLDTSDIAKTVAMGVAGRMGTTGQACNSPKRFIIKENIYNEFVSEFLKQLEAVKPGNPADPSVEFGPLSSHSAVDGLLSQIQDAVSKGAKVHVGGKKIEGKGAFFEPTLLTDVTPGMRAYKEELFGPVAVIYKVGNDEQAIQLANDSPYGLSSMVWSENLTLARNVADKLDCGMVWINGLATSKPEMPFGGVKRSGLGRELGKYGMDEFVNKKIIHISEPIT